MFQFLGRLAGWTYNRLITASEQNNQPATFRQPRHSRHFYERLVIAALPIAENQLAYVHQFVLEHDCTLLEDDANLNEIIKQALHGLFDAQLEDASREYGLGVLPLRTKVISLLSQTLIQREIVTVMRNSHPRSATLPKKRPAQLSPVRRVRQRVHSPEGMLSSTGGPPESCVVARYVFQRPDGLKDGWRGVLSQDRGVRALNGKINLYDILRLDGVGRKADLKEKHIEILQANGVRDADSYNFQRLVWIPVEAARAITRKLTINKFDLEPLFEAASRN